ncbi:Fe-S cluster assembly sulfur transfer protein SufU [Microbacterium lushaniae]|uniref:SUF system NifU family Fe-S cluster assembly protein n=1 Tax=Microbacterium lushaniae TaxID=2614639 RepID=A0A5J6L6J8_9MICO|nr:SUF system NifU family Fe-S cluster assembly protein [Microbacterium lushaniae]QEW04056.1 SUF system NifU family Fe-S cluster assembly protein [Microbacterium lushaniae]
MSDLNDLYREVILDHSRRPVGRGDVSGFATTHHELNPTCGDEITLGVEIAPDGRISALAWEGSGCSISTASASVMSDLVRDGTREEAAGLIADFRALMRGGGEMEPAESLGDAAAFAGVSRLVTRVKCAMLPWVALEACLRTAP